MRFSFRLIAGLAILISQLVASDRSVSAQDDLPEQVIQPIGVVSISSVDRVLKEFGQVFELSGRPDMIEVMHSTLAGGQFLDLQGIDRDRPLGMMVFIGTDLPPRPVFVTYIPVSDEAKLVELTKKSGQPVTLKREGVYQIGTSEKNSPELHFRDGYAFTASPGGNEFLKHGRIPHPEESAARLVARYDVAASVNLRGIPPLMKQVFATFFTQQSAAQMQQRDHESDASYQLRRANGLSALQWVEQLIRDGQELTIGLDSSTDGKRAVLEVSVDAEENTTFAKCLTGIAGAPSIFTPLLQERHPFQLSMSWNADPREKTALLGYLESMKLALRSRIPESGQASIDQLVETLQATVNAGHIDAIFQFIPYQQKEFVLLAGVKVLGTESLDDALHNVSRELSAASSDIQIDLDMHEYEGVKLSRLRGIRSNPEIQRTYGGPPDLYYGVGDQVFWLALGGAGVIPEIDKAIDVLADPVSRDLVSSTAPFELMFRAVPWLGLPQSERGGKRAAERRELVQSAMKSDSDALRVEVRPSESGVRLTLRFDEGFVRLLGLTLAQMYDRTQL